MESTISVAKGVFLFKNGFKANTKRTKKRKLKTKSTSNIYSDTLWYKSYSLLWDSLEGKIQNLNDEMFSSVLGSLVTYIKNSYNDAVTEIPATALMTGINMPDHAAQFSSLAKKIRSEVSPHVAFLQSQDCQNLKYLVENMVNQLVGKEDAVSDDEDEDTERKRSRVKKSQCSMSYLQAWYEDTVHSQPSPKKKSTRSKKDIIVLIIPDFESFSENVLQNFILIISNYINILPFVLVFGVATSLSVLHRTLPYHVSSRINVSVFNSQPSIVYLNKILEEVFFSESCPFHLGGKVFSLLTDIFLFYDLSVTEFISNFKYAMLEHFSYGNALALCCPSEEIGSILEELSYNDCENVRRLMSFRKLIENETHENRIKLFKDDEFFKERLKKEVCNIKRYIKNLHLFLKGLHVLVSDLPKAPLGKQVRELYALAATENITKTKEYQECLQLLKFQSKEELSQKISKLSDLISQEIPKDKGLRKVLDELNVYVNNIGSVAVDEEVPEESTKNVIGAKMDRKQLKETLKALSKQSKHQNRYEKMRTDLLTFLDEVFQKYLVEPTSFYFHEIFFFNDMSIQNHIIGSHRAAIHNALNDPHYYLQCNCCEISEESRILPCMPDISIVYKLHLECGKMINLYDWLQAFLSIVDPTEVEDEKKRIVRPELQARFTQAVAELEFLGFIKSSKRKMDHVARLTWGG